MFAEKLANAISAIKNASIKEASRMNGICENDIQIIEGKLRLVLPDTFKEFLLVCGSGGNRFLVDNGFVLYPRIIKYKDEVLKEAVNDGEYLPLTEASVIFKTYQGEEFWFFNCSNDVDPEVLFAEWGESRSENTGYKLSDFIISFFKNSLLEKKKADKLSSLNVIESFSYGKLDRIAELRASLNDVNENIALFKQPLVEVVLVDNLLRCIGQINMDSDVAKDLIELLDKLDVKEAQVAIALEERMSELGLRFLHNYARQHEIDDAYLKEILRS